MKVNTEIVRQMNSFGKKGQSFVFLIDFLGQKPVLFPFYQNKLLWKTPELSNFKPSYIDTEKIEWEMNPVSFETYAKGFNKVMQHIQAGDTYLLNYTQPTLIKTNLSLEKIFILSSAPYKIFMKNQFVCFSPETFVKIKDGKISSYPMKGTIDAGIRGSRKTILNNSKELAEHNTIVDLIRNDLSVVSENVTVEKFRYLQRIQTMQGDLWQVSSKISGFLPNDFQKNIGDIIFSLLPAGSISGAPKKKTIDIIIDAEKYNRGYYTGVFGVFDGKNLDSCVLIRYIEQQGEHLVYKSGGGITFMSDLKMEYEELLKKIYIPISD